MAHGRSNSRGNALQHGGRRQVALGRLLLMARGQLPERTDTRLAAQCMNAYMVGVMHLVAITLVTT